nr:MAG TPA: hypothetical protein [Caudoviricetes sp.]DAY85867.1 MAG TPA: hypothetical protein [Caudoviricetes sp.]
MDKSNSKIRNKKLWQNRTGRPSRRRTGPE